jgi:virulence-associated protein VagC
LKVSIIEILGFPEAVAVFRTALSRLIKLPEDVDFDLSKLKVNRSESLKILSNPADILACLDHAPNPNFPNFRETMIKLWRQCWCLVCIAASPPIDFSEHSWKEKARKFACLCRYLRKLRHTCMCLSTILVTLLLGTVV